MRGQSPRPSRFLEMSPGVLITQAAEDRPTLMREEAAATALAAETATVLAAAADPEKWRRERRQRRQEQLAAVISGAYSVSLLGCQFGGRLLPACPQDGKHISAQVVLLDVVSIKLVVRFRGAQRVSAPYLRWSLWRTSNKQTQFVFRPSHIRSRSSYGILRYQERRRSSLPSKSGGSASGGRRRCAANAC